MISFVNITFLVITIFVSLSWLLLLPDADSRSSRESNSSKHHNNNDISNPSYLHLAQDQQPQKQELEEFNPGLVVCSVDGTVYTLDAWSGELRGLFPSGPALVSSSTLEHPLQGGGEEGSDSYSGKLKIVPGLDGNIYTLTESVEDGSISLDILPISAKDVAESPVSTCDTTSSSSEECGIVMGEKRTKVFALDATSGSVKWMQNPSSTKDGFTTSLTNSFIRTSSNSNTNYAKDKNKNKQDSSSVLLLQRDDYFVRQIHHESGEEQWNLTVAHFSALDFPSSQNKQKKTSYANAGAAKDNLPKSGISDGFSLLGSGKFKEKRRKLSDLIGNLPSNKERKSLDYIDFPSIAFGEDGTSVIAVDSLTGSLLWKTKLASVVASVYGVGRENSWVPIDVVKEPLPTNDQDHSPNDDSSSQLDHYSKALSTGTVPKLSNLPLPIPLPFNGPIGDPSSALSQNFLFSSDKNDKNDNHLSSSHALVPINKNSKDTPRLGLHLSTLFVVSAPSTCNADSYSKNRYQCKNPDQPHWLSNKHHNHHLYTDNNGVIPPLPMPSQPPGTYPYYLLMKRHSHKTEHGLFLTWKMVSMVVCFLLGIALVGWRKIHGWHTKHYTKADTGITDTTSYILSSASSSSLQSKSLDHNYEEEKRRSYSDLDQLPHKYVNQTPNKLSKSPWALSRHISDVPPPSIQRSRSFPKLKQLARSSSMSQLTDQHLSISFMDKINKYQNNNQDLTLLYPNKIKTCDSFPLSFQKSPTILLNGTLPLTKSNTNSPTTKTAPLSTASTLTTKLPPTITPQMKAITTIDGIPLVQYSRYKSEFTEKTHLGKGGFGTVFRCINTLDQKEYAIKKIMIEYEKQGGLSKTLDRVLREVKILALLDHPNIVGYYTAWLEVEEQNQDTEGNFIEDKYENEGEDTDHDTRCFSMTNSIMVSASHMSATTTSNGLGNYWHEKKKRRKTGLKMTNPLKCCSNSSFSLEESFSEDGTACRSLEEMKMVVEKSESEEDLGFTWERSESYAKSIDKFDDKYDDNKSSAEKSKNSLYSWIRDGSRGHTTRQDNHSETFDTSLNNNNNNNPDSRNEDETELSESNSSDSFGFYDQSDLDLPSKSQGKDQIQLPKRQRHLLYIQMQLCSQKTLADYLASPSWRSQDHSSSYSLETNGNIVDIPYALKLFSQITRGVKHVHQQGLIHRDLKPSNCFIDDSGVVKIGDFGLSRESSTSSQSMAVEGDDSNIITEKLTSPSFIKSKLIMDVRYSNLGGEQSNTAGIGTRSYASPEQMNGSDYGASTDVYSLGVMLFELCYPMYTGMERFLVFNEIRNRKFPQQWNSTIKVEFPSVHELLHKMLSNVPSERPESAVVADSIDSLLGEYTVQSLDRIISQKQEASLLLLRIEALGVEGVLRQTIDDIKKASPRVVMLQYSLRGHGNNTIMEFALTLPTADDEEDPVQSIFAKLKENVNITLVRKVTYN